MAGRVKLLLASANAGKLRDYEALTAGHAVELALLADLDRLPRFEESAPNFAENAAGKALHYSRFTPEFVIADDSGLVVTALGVVPGPKSARYAGPDATDAQRVGKLLEELRAKGVSDRQARFVCALALARAGRLLAVFSDFVEGTLAEAPRGQGGFGYDPIFFYAPLGRTFAEISRAEKNQHSHRGKACRKLLAFLESSQEQMRAS